MVKIKGWPNALNHPLTPSQQQALKYLSEHFKDKQVTRAWTHGTFDVPDIPEIKSVQIKSTFGVHVPVPVTDCTESDFSINPHRDTLVGKYYYDRCMAHGTFRETMALQVVKTTSDSAEVVYSITVSAGDKIQPALSKLSDVMGEMYPEHVRHFTPRRLLQISGTGVVFETPDVRLIIKWEKERR